MRFFAYRFLTDGIAFDTVLVSSDGFDVTAV